MVTTRLRKCNMFGFRVPILYYVKIFEAKKPQRKREGNINISYPAFRKIYVR